MKKRKDGRYQKSLVDARTGKRIYFYGFTEKEVPLKIMKYSGSADIGRSAGEAFLAKGDKKDIAAKSLDFSRLFRFFRAKFLCSILKMKNGYFPILKGFELP